MNSKYTLRALFLRSFSCLAFVFAGLSSFAQQPPDCGSCTCASWPSVAGTLVAPVCDGSFYPYTIALNQYGRMNVVVGNQYTVTLCGLTAANSFIYITTNTTTPSPIACDDDGCGVPNGPSSVTFVAAATTQYRIYIRAGACGANLLNNAAPITVSIRCQGNTPPPNDNVCNAEVITMSPNCTFIPSTTYGATPQAITGTNTTPLCTGALFASGQDVWFRTTVPASGVIGIQTQEGSICAGAFAVYAATSCSGPFTQIANSCTVSGMTGSTSEPAALVDVSAYVGQQIYIRYWERNGNENGTFELCAYEAIPPPNDNPCGSIALPLGTSCNPATYSTENATPLAANMTAAYGTCGGGPPTNDMWFSFTVPATPPPSGITVNTIAGTLNNYAMAWYRLTGGSLCGPGTLTQIGCNQDQGGGNLMPRINSTALAPLVGGETIYVRVWVEAPVYVGTFQICAYINQTPTNDDPCGAIPLPVNYGCVMSTHSNEAATQTTTSPTGTVSVPNPGCGGTPNSDVWFTVTVPPNGVLQFDSQSGSMNNAALAVYRINSGSCATGNLNLVQVGCAASGAGPTQGPASAAMPYLSLTGLTPGATLYVRVWRDGAAEGTFNLCVRRTDPPPGDCFYTLNMMDSGGDGWGGSFVTVCVGGACNNYTVNGANASVNIGANIGQPISVHYTAAGGFQNQNSYVLSQYGSPVFASGSPPVQSSGPYPGTPVWSNTVTCDPPPAPQSDCIGAHTLCDQNTQVNQNPTNTGGVVDLNTSNRGCLSGNERRGLWYVFQVSQAGNLGFTIVPAAGADYDFAVWGPYPSGSSPGTICVNGQGQATGPPGPPTRCSWAAGSGPTGLAINPALPTTEGAGGTSFVRHLTVSVGQVYLLYVDNWSMNGVTFNMSWTGDASVSCVILPVELLDFTAKPEGDFVKVDWRTASEQNALWFDVERAADGVHFTDIGRVSASGTTFSTTAYQFVDENPLQGISYYRLRQVDVNGGASNSEIATVFMRSPAPFELFPNPATEELWLGLEMKDETRLQWRILDMSGRLVLESAFTANSGMANYPVPVSKLESGSYAIEVLDREGTQIGILRFVKQ